MAGSTCNISSEQIISALKKAGLNRGDCVFVHSALSKFGHISEAKDKKMLAEIVIKCFSKVIGPSGTIAIPTYTYSFTKNETYNPLTTPSPLGILTEELRKMPNTERSINPIHSTAAVGPKAKLITQNLDHSSFGRNSSLGRLYDINATLVFFGVDLESGVFVHYIEEAFGVPYRYNKTFKGKIYINNKLLEDTYSFYVRPLDKNVETYLIPLQKHLVSKGLMIEVKLGKGYIRTIKAKTLYDEGMKLLKKNVYFFLKERPNI